MPKLMNVSASVATQTTSGFSLSSKKPEDLGASEYTLVDVEIDVSPSVEDFLPLLNESIGLILDTCKKNPRSANTLLSISSFSDIITNIHGFNELKDLVASQYNLAITGTGTDLYGATFKGLEAIDAYSKQLYGLDFLTNAVQFVVTDGMDNCRRSMPAKIAAFKAGIKKEEKLESVKTILLGVGDNTQVKAYLETLKDEANFDQFEWSEGSTPSHIARITGFISRSISSTSQALGTQGPSQNLNF